MRKTRAERASIADESRLEALRRQFKRSVERARGEKIYTPETAWVDNPGGSNRVLGDALDEQRRLAERLQRNIARLERQCVDARERLDAGRSASSSSTMFGDAPAEIERDAAKLDAVTELARSLADRTGWYVPSLLSPVDRMRAELLRHVEVVEVVGVGGVGDGYALYRDDATGSGDRWFDGVRMVWAGADDRTVYQTASYAWLTFGLLCGWKLEG